MTSDDALRPLDGAYYFDLRTKATPKGREYAVGVQWEKGGPVIRITDTDLGRAVEEAVREARGVA